MKPLEASTGERSTRGRREGDNPTQKGETLRVQEEETNILLCYRVVGAGLGTPPEENPKPLEDMEEGRSMKGERPEGKGKERQFADVPKV